MSRMDVISPRKRQEKTHWVKLGSAWMKDDGSISVVLDATPLQDEKGECRLLIVKPKDRDEAPAPRQQSKGSAPTDLGDDVPFLMEWR